MKLKALADVALPLVLISLMTIGGCSGPTYKTTYYTLVADGSGDKAPLPTEAHYTASLGVGPLQLPEMLDHPGIVSQKGAQQVLVAPYDVWAGDLKQAMTRVLADNLSTYLGSDNVWPFPWDNRIRPEQQLSILVEHFSGERGGDVELQGKWRLLTDQGQRVSQSGKVKLRTETKSSSYSDYVSAMNELLNQMAEHIALEIADK